MATFNSNNEILNAIDDNKRIRGVVEIDYEDVRGLDLDQYNDVMTNRLIGEKWGYLLEDISYKLVGCNVERETVLIEVDASCDSLLAESDLVEEK